MGVHGLPKYLNKKFFHVFKPFNGSLTNSRIAIDIGGFMHTFTEAMEYPTHYVDRFLAFAKQMKDMGVHFVFVFDGISEKLKSNTLFERRLKRERLERNIDRQVDCIARKERKVALEIVRIQRALLAESAPKSDTALDLLFSHTCEMHRFRWNRKAVLLRKNPVCRRFFYHLESVFAANKIPYLVADSEAEQACAWLAQRGHVDIILSEDYDTLVFGAPVMLRNWNNRGNGSRGMCPTVIRLDEILEALRLTYNQFIDVCVIAGTDFTSLNSIGFKKALEKMRLLISLQNPKIPPEGHSVLQVYFNRFVKSSYSSDILAERDLQSLFAARKLFEIQKFPFSRSLLILSLLWITRLSLTPVFLEFYSLENNTDGCSSRNTSRPSEDKGPECVLSAGKLPDPFLENPDAVWSAFGRV